MIPWMNAELVWVVAPVPRPVILGTGGIVLSLMLGSIAWRMIAGPVGVSRWVSTAVVGYLWWRLSH